LRSAGSDPQREELSSAADVMRAATVDGEVTRVAALASDARERSAGDSAWRSISCFLEGATRHLMGERQVAEARLEEGARQGAVVAPGPHVLCLSQLAMMAAERGDHEGAAAAVGRACAQVDHYELTEYPTTALVFAVAAAVRARQARVDQAQAHLRRARQQLDRLGDFAPWYRAEVRVELARAALILGDVPLARECLTDARRDARRLVDAPLLAGWIDGLETGVDAAAAVALPGSLTAAELRILRLLPTHLSFREIAGSLYVSANTVKSQAHAVYRKLDAQSRSEAVARAQELGLLRSPPV
jgi:LuxR family maltose regulon positive regulatory protein